MQKTNKKVFQQKYCYLTKLPDKIPENVKKISMHYFKIMEQYYACYFKYKSLNI